MFHSIRQDLGVLGYSLAFGVKEYLFENFKESGGRVIDINMGHVFIE